MEGMRVTETPKRFSVRDMNGDQMFDSDVYSHAAQNLRLWGGKGSIFDREEGETVLTQEKGAY